jgi:hypothetical protein
MTNRQRLASKAVHTIPEPFCTYMGQVNTAVVNMRGAAANLGIKREFSMDGRFLGDLGEVIAKTQFGIDLHHTQHEGEDAVCQISGKSVEVKLRSKSTLVWVKKIPDFLVAIYLCPATFRWGVKCNGSGAALLKTAKWDAQHLRFETDLFKLVGAQEHLPPGSPALSLAAPLN